MNIMTAFRFGIASFIVATVVAAASAVSVGAISQGGVGGRPANPDPNNPRTESIFLYQLKASDTKQDAVLVMNTSDKEQSLTLYAVDGILTNTGAYACKQEVEAKTSVGGWVSFQETQVTLPANTTKKVDFSVTVPANTEAGEHNGCVVFQSASDDGEVQGNVRIRTRQAIRMAITVPGKLEKSVDIAAFTAHRTRGLEQFAMTVKNKGNVSSDIEASIDLRTFWGSSVYSNKGGYPVLANSELQLNFVNEQPPFFGGWYQAVARVAYDSRPGTYGVEDNQYKVEKTATPITVFVAPHPVAFALYILLLIAAVVGGYLLYRRHQDNKRIASWQQATVKAKDTIADLAAAHGVPWQLVARANRLKRPYILTKGSTILLPPQVKKKE